jgi:guanylate kinase
LAATGYRPPEDVQSVTTVPPKKKPLLPRAGDVVRYYDLDGGKAKGQVLVGKISFISPDLSTPNGWKVELTELEDVGEGYYAEYSSTKRSWKKTTRDLPDVSPVAASFVRNESAFKVPIDRLTGGPKARAEQYDLDAFTGPVSDFSPQSQTILEADAVLYKELKGRLLRYAAISGLAGTLIADVSQGGDFAAVYGAGFVSSLGYLFLLSLKTDSLATTGPMSKLAQNVSALRFVMPLLVFVGVALYNQSLGDANPAGGSMFSSVTSRQFAAAILGFLTYRLPLFGIQLQGAFSGDDDDNNKEGLTLPGSAGIALQMVTQDSPVAEITTAVTADLPTVLLISGPQATGRSALVEELVSTDDRFTRPKMVDRVVEGASFERLEQRDEFLSITEKGRYGLTKENLLESAKDVGTKQVVVLDADVPLAQEITKIAGLRVVGVWVGLESVKEFEGRLSAALADGSLSTPEGETAASVTRARLKEIVKEIEYGLSSGIFEFTVLNKDPKESLRQLKEAGAYCFK